MLSCLNMDRSDHYDHKQIEPKWQKKWEEGGIYRADPKSGKPKSYVLDMFPYPSGEGLHVGHPKGYIATDVYARHKRMTGHEVLHPMGWDAFGLPAENYAIKNKIHPRVAVERNIARFKDQLHHIGFDYDWSREINTTDPAYYKWTQWIFLQLYKKGLAFPSDEPINWCPSCKTGLANEDLEGGVCERCGAQVEKKALPQWVLRITDYADRLLEDLSLLPKWPEHIKESQRNWIGRSEGAEIDFEIKDQRSKIKVFTTRPDTLFGATYMVVAPEHAIIPTIKDHIENWSEVIQYISEASAKSEIERSAEGKEKTGVELKGVRAINPANQEELPIFVADYVLGSYGTGAIMAVPAHDERDYAFAVKFGLPIKQVIRPVFGVENKRPDAIHRETVNAIVRNKKGEVLLIHWKDLPWITGVIGGIEEGETPEQAAVREVLEETGYKARPIYTSPITIEAHYFSPHKNAWSSRINHPILLELEDETPIEVAESEKDLHSVVWVSRQEALRTVTFDNNILALNLVLGIAPAYATKLGDERQELINSGEFSGMESDEAKQKIAEHVGGKMVTRYKLRDWVFSRQRYWGEPIPLIHCEKCGVVPVPENELPVLLPEVESYEPSGTGESPLATISEWVNTTCPSCGGPAKRETNTMPQWAGSSWYYLRYMDPQNNAALVAPEKEKYWAPVDLYVGGAEHATRHLIYARFWHKFLYDIGVASTKEPFMELHSVGLILAEDGRKMSKRYGNVVNPDDIVERFGADSLRVYEMFMGPFDNAIAWSTDGLVGARRFIERVWKFADQGSRTSDKLETLLHQTIKKVGEDIENFKHNTAVSSLMILLNAMEKEGASADAYAIFLRLLAPLAPHITEELWSQLGHTTSIHLEPWPQFDPSKLLGESVRIAIQINGKTRGTVDVARDVSEEDLIAAARDAVADKLASAALARTVVVPGRLVNFVVAQ